ncbi:MAG TPA: hypothetical protein V6D13_20560 [Halomicronema sp.]
MPSQSEKQFPPDKADLWALAIFCNRLVMWRGYDSQYSKIHRIGEHLEFSTERQGRKDRPLSVKDQAESKKNTFFPDDI